MIGRTLFETLTELYPDNPFWRYKDETATLDLNNLIFEDGSVPDEAAIMPVFNVKLAEIEAEDAASLYQRIRRYPSIGDQLDDLYHNENATFSDEMNAKIKATKDKYPKDNSGPV
jgi:hypothetical protein